ncbi:MAG: hypothetical protein ABI273_19620 [Lacunisphaera sp.]
MERRTRRRLMIPQLAADIPFVGRGPLLRRLERLYRAQRCVLLFGQTGVGKTALMGKLEQGFPVLYAPRCRYLGELIDVLEPQAKLEKGELKLAARVHRLIAQLPRLGRPLVLDHVARVPPKVAHLVRVLLAEMPVWLLTRSVLPLDIGHLWPYLFMFKRIDVPPFSLEETRSFLRAAPFSGDRNVLLAATLRLHRLSAGHPATLIALIEELRQRTYDLTTMDGLHLLALHARITYVEAQLAVT